MRRNLKLSLKADFKNLFGRGRRVDSQFFRLVYRKNSIGHVRLAFITPRATEKSSVLRNRLRRRAREWARKHKELSGWPIDVAIIFKGEALRASKKIFYEELEKIFIRIHGI